VVDNDLRTDNHDTKEQSVIFPTLASLIGMPRDNVHCYFIECKLLYLYGNAPGKRQLRVSKRGWDILKAEFNLDTCSRDQGKFHLDRLISVTSRVD